MHAFACVVTGDFAGATTQANDSAETDVVVLFEDAVTFDVQDAERKSGPQKMIRYPIAMTNDGNARAIVRWELIEKPGGRWNILLPDHAIVEPGATLTAIVSVATPYENGYVSDKAAFSLRAVTSAADDPDQVGSSTDVTLQAKAEGWYVPGPGAPLLMAVLALAAAIARPQ